MREIDGLRSELAVKAYEAPDFDEEDYWQHWVEVLGEAAELLWQYSDLCE
jgi:hypothetical protein